MANIHEITRNLIQQRGEVKAALIKCGEFVEILSVGHTTNQVEKLLYDLAHYECAKFTGTIWFKSGSYAYLDKDGAGYYWNYIQVPEIPKELC